MTALRASSRVSASRPCPRHQLSALPHPPAPYATHWLAHTLCGLSAHQLCHPRSRQRSRAACAPDRRGLKASSLVCRAGKTSQVVWSAPLDDPWTALLLAWFASKGRSLLAAQCLVEAVLQLYMSGTTFAEIQVGLKVASARIGATQPVVPQPVGPAMMASMPLGVDIEGADEPVSTGLLSDQEEGELLSWTALVLLAAEAAGITPAQRPQQDTADPTGSSSNRYLKGMKGFVSQAYGMWQGGMTLQRLTDLQAAVSQGQSAFGVQAVMQQYTRIAIMALEVLAMEGLVQRPTIQSEPSEVDFMGRPAPSQPATNADVSSTSSQTGSESDPADTESSSRQLLRPVGYTSTFVNGPVACQLPSASMDGVEGARPHAIRLLMAFMGAVLGSGYALEKFVESAFLAYSQGWTAGELADALQQEDYLQTGGLVQAVSAPPATRPPPPTTAPAGPPQPPDMPIPPGPSMEAGPTSGTPMSDTQERLSPPVTPEGLQGGIGGPSVLDRSPGPSPSPSAARDAGDFQGAMGAPSGPEAAAAAAAGQAPEINAELFSLWVSSTYMALARLGAPFPGAAERPGWAWAGRGDATDAVGVDNFVRNAIRMSMAQDNPQQTSTDPQSSSQVPPSTSSQPSATPAIQADTNQQSDSSLATPPSPADTMLTSQSSLTSRLEAATDPASLDSLGVSSGSDRSGQQSGSDGNSSGKTLVVAPGVAAAVTDPSLAKLAEDENVARQWQQAREVALQELVTEGRLRGKPLPAGLVKLLDEDLAATSTAVRVMGMQVQLVRCVYQLALRAQQTAQEAA